MSSSATVPAPEAEPRRPVAVVAAAGLMLAVAVTYLVASVLALVTLNKVIGAARYDDFDDGTRHTITTIKATMVVTVVVYVAIAVTLLVLAARNLRGRKGARLGTWVIAGLFLVCALCGSIGNGSATAGMISQDSTLISEVYPSWYIPVTITLDVVLVLLYAGIIVLLALPGSNRYFRFEKLPPLVRR